MVPLRPTLDLFIFSLKNKKKVTGLEEYIKKEKDESNEVAKYSQRQLHKIKDNADTLEILIRSLKV